MSDFESKWAALSEERRAELTRVHEAMRRAAVMARLTAIETNTGIVMVQDGKPVRISAAELRAGIGWGTLDRPLLCPQVGQADSY